jgi:two-component system chemotaxis sensor kinase CheA
VALILDVAGLALKVNLTSLSGSRRAQNLAQEAERERYQETHALLLFQNTPDERCALPLDLVQRIERISPAQIEQVGGRRTMQYRGASLPLLALADTARVSPVGSGQDLVVIVSSVAGREIGLLGTMPVDVIEIHAKIDQRTHRQPGIAGSTIVHDQTTMIINLFELVDAVYPEWRTMSAAAASGPADNASPTGRSTQKTGPTILLAEDSDFFRAQVRRFLEEDGCKVLDAPDGEAAWVIFQENSENIQAVVTDIEMPRLNGLDLARRIRAHEGPTRIPIIAVTSLASEDDQLLGRAAGIDDYQIKLDRDQLLTSVRMFTGR